MKTGELEAKTILEKLGYQMDESYVDDNSKKSMPDLRMKNGRFVEVTHTKHNYQISNYWKLPIEEKNSKIDNCQKALDTIKNPQTSREQLKECPNLIKNHLGYDIATGEFSEFKCDIPSREYSIKNIIREIEEDKGSKYKNKDTDLFVFISEDEFRLIDEATNSMKNELLCSFYNSPFEKMWICKYEYRDGYIYDVENLDIFIFTKEKTVSVNRVKGYS